MTFGAKLRILRKSNHLLHKDIAKAIGVSDRTISMWERNKSLPSHINMIKLINFFGVSPNYFVNQDATTIITDEYTVINQLQQLLASLPESDLDKMFQLITEIYFNAKSQLK